MMCVLAGKGGTLLVCVSVCCVCVIRVSLLLYQRQCRVILRRQEAGEQKQEVVVVTNMFDELQRLECAALLEGLFGNKVPGVRQRTHTHSRRLCAVFA